jgi:hypothetical protein
MRFCKSTFADHCYSRHGQIEDREPYRLKDKSGIPVLCFRCGTSSLPNAVDVSAPPAKRPRRSTSSAHSATPEVWRNMLSCDYCSLHWHLDCLDPPLVSMPPFNKKWMCPNHAEHAVVSHHGALTWTFVTHLCIATQASCS